jgi:transcriptional regulator with XRE-family HTH domain
VSLAKYLRDVRAVRGKSLRAVEDATGISNAYLSQLERGDATKPSPDKLKELAKFYEVSYTDLMRVAGYLTRSSPSPMVASGAGDTPPPPENLSALQAALMSAPLTPDEEEAVVKYIQFLRFRNKK